MGKLDTPFGFTGRVDRLSFYRRRGSDDIIVRRSNGHSGKRIKTDPKFTRTMQNSSEFRARNKFVFGLYKHWDGMKPAFDYKVYNELMSRTRAIQKLETIGGRGERGLTLSKNGQILEGLPFNKKFGLENIVSPDLEYNIDLQTSSATVRVLQLMPDLHFHNLPNLPFFRFMAILLSVPDIIWQNDQFQPTSVFNAKFAFSDWHNSIDIFPGTELKLELPTLTPHPTCLVLSFAVLFGKGGEEAVKYVGAGKILKVECGGKV